MTLKQFWHNYGQTTLGFVEFIVGSAEYVDANTINLIGGILGPKYGPMVSKGIQAFAGLAVAYRGYQARIAAKQNSIANPTQPVTPAQPEEKKS